MAQFQTLAGENLGAQQNLPRSRLQSSNFVNFKNESEQFFFAEEINIRKSKRKLECLNALKILIKIAASAIGLLQATSIVLLELY